MHLERLVVQLVLQRALLLVELDADLVRRHLVARRRVESAAHSGRGRRQRCPGRRCEDAAPTSAFFSSIAWPGQLWKNADTTTSCFFFLPQLLSRPGRPGRKCETCNPSNFPPVALLYWVQLSHLVVGASCQYEFRDDLCEPFGGMRAQLRNPGHAPTAAVNVAASGF